MPKINFTYALKRFFPGIEAEDVEAPDVGELLYRLDEKYPGIRGYLVDDQGRLRRHVNVFVDGELIVDRTTLSDPLTETSEVYIMQALSGG